MVYFVRGEDCWKRSLTHQLIRGLILISIGMKPFWGSKKQSHERLCSKWRISYHCGGYHTTVEGRDS